MKKNIIIYLCLATILTLCGCYDDKGGNDFDTVLTDSVEINIPKTVYSGSIGETITIEPQIKTNIPESDLRYSWEVNGERKNANWRHFYAPLVNEDKQQRKLEYVCKLDSNIVNLNKKYNCRLRVEQKSTGRYFYSSENFTITITGLNGLMILHGNDKESDVGILEAEDFTPASNSIPESPKAIPNCYSNFNGSKIPGKGEQILQGLTINSVEYGRHPERCRIYIKTSDKALFANMEDMSTYGDWDKMFYLTGDRKVNSGKPRGYNVIYGWDAAIAFDGDDIFFMTQSSTYPFLMPALTPKTVCLDGNTFKFEPKVQVANYAYFANYILPTAAIMYTTEVNGKPQKGFVKTVFSSGSKVPQRTSLLDTKSDLVKFNPSNMKADLLTMATNNQAHIFAVLKGDNTNPEYVGKIFAVELNLNPRDKATGNSGLAQVPQQIYDLSSLTEINNAVSFEFGQTSNMCYYTTNSAIYKYGLDKGKLYNAEKLTMADGSALNFNGEITMAKMFDNQGILTYNTDEILLVATWNGTESTLYALHLAEDTGNVNKVVKFDRSTVKDWKFGKIYDVGIKGL